MRIASVALLLTAGGSTLLTAGGSTLLTAGCAAAGDPRVDESARSYASYRRVDETRRWAPAACKAPAPKPLKVSASRDSETHGRKLYYLFAKDREAYRIARDRAQPVGQVIVKESRVPAAASTRQNPAAGDKGPLFIMMKTGDADSDEGWIYATATPDGTTITARGKLASCMDCHQSAKHDRLFAVSCD